jgi:hypothetical protein
MVLLSHAEQMALRTILEANRRSRRMKWWVGGLTAAASAATGTAAVMVDGSSSGILASAGVLGALQILGGIVSYYFLDRTLQHKLALAGLELLNATLQRYHQERFWKNQVEKVNLVELVGKLNKQGSLDLNEIFRVNYADTDEGEELA